MHPKPKKSLGQNFLLDKNIQRKIIESSELKSTDCVLEIGAGRGELTQLIAPRVVSVFALEIDKYLSEILKERFKECANVKIINQDILKFDLKKYFPGFKGKLKVVGNIPYYISSPILERLIKYGNKIEVIFLTVQKEFGRRIVAQPGSKDYGSLSCFLQYYTQPKILFYIKKNSFLPSPKVNSCFLRLEMRRKTGLSKEEEKSLFKIIRLAFNKRRKTLRNSLKDILPQEKLNIFFKNYGINPNIRPEDLALKDFENLVKS